METVGFFPCGAAYFYQYNGRSGIDFKWQGQAIIIGALGDKFSAAYYRWGTIETDINDLRLPNKIFDILRRDGNLHLNLASTKYQVRYLVDSPTLVFLTHIRSGV